MWPAEIPVASIAQNRRQSRPSLDPGIKTDQQRSERFGICQLESRAGWRGGTFARRRAVVQRRSPCLCTKPDRTREEYDELELGRAAWAKLRCVAVRRRDDCQCQ